MHARVDKLRARIDAGDGNLRFEQVDSYLCNTIGAVKRQHGTSHVVYELPGGIPITLVKPHGNRKTVNPRYIRNLAAKLGESSL